VFSSLSDRDADHGAVARKNANGRKKIVRTYAGIGIAVATLIESTVRVTIRHSDNEPIASEAATASVSRDEATGADGRTKPASPGDRVMADILWPVFFNARANHRGIRNFAGTAGNIGAACPRKWLNGGGVGGYAHR
jgi:hypothetical protein